MLKDFEYKKSLGQNFLTDQNLLAAIVRDAGVNAGDFVLEAGAGAGALTESLADAGAFVTAYEIDRRLEPVLTERFRGRSNVELVFADVLEADLTAYFARAGEYKLLGNLPYYITTPIIFKFLEARTPPVSITVMVQLEVAKRLCAAPATPDYGALSAAVQVRSRPVITRRVSKKLFVPVPNVDSAIVRIDLTASLAKPGLERAVSKVIRAAFAMRRKTLANNFLQLGIPRARTEAALRELGQLPDTRGETLSPAQFAALAEIFAGDLGGGA